MGVPQAVQSLSLCWAFRGYRQKVTDCITPTTEREFYLKDDEQTNTMIITSASGDDKVCKVSNPSGREAVVLAIDRQSGGRHCRWCGFQSVRFPLCGIQDQCHLPIGCRCRRNLCESHAATHFHPRFVRGSAGKSPCRLYD